MTTLEYPQQLEIVAKLKFVTPVESHNGFLFKRDDLFRPFEDNDLNGGKLRQCLLLLLSEKPTGIITASSIHSPQNALVACSARFIGRPCIVLYGGRTETRYVKYCKEFGADIRYYKCARHSVLFYYADPLRKQTGFYIIGYGMRPLYTINAFYDQIAQQVANIPSQLGTIVVTCGSGITLISILYGF